MKILIITYYWPPSGGSGVQRWLKFVKYLRDFGIEPVVYTAKDPKYPIVDKSLEREVPGEITVLRQPVFEPNRFFSFLGKKSKKQSSGLLEPNPGFFGKVFQYIRANYFVPDARKFWIKPSVKYLKKYLINSDIDLIISTGPPHSMHLIGLNLKKKLGIPWIADFRDPWTKIDYFHQLPLTKKSKKKHFELEKSVISSADATIVVGKTMKENFQKYTENIHVITNGFDTVEVPEKEAALDTTFTITHIGLLNADRNPKVLWEVLREICAENATYKKDLKIQIIGKCAAVVKNDLTSFDMVNSMDYVDHEKARSYQLASQVLLLAINNVPGAKGIITGKLFEYLQAHRPILGIGPVDGDAADIINEAGAGVMVDFEDKKKLKTVILEYYHKFKNNDLFVENRNIEKYHRKELTGKLAEVIKEVVGKK